MDLRLIYYGSREEDVGTGQVGRRVVADKYYHDKKKLALAGKAQLNEYISTYDLDVQQAQNLKVCTIQLLGMFIMKSRKSLLAFILMHHM